MNLIDNKFTNVKYILLTFLFIGCALEPEIEYIYQDRIINVAIPTGEVPLQYSYAQIYEMYSIWKQKQGVVLWVVAQNLSDSSWYGYPEIRAYTTDQPMAPDRGLTEYDLMSKGKGVLTTEIDYNMTPIDIVDFIPAFGYRQAIAFTEINYDETKRYLYVLWRFVEDGG